MNKKFLTTGFIAAVATAGVLASVAYAADGRMSHVNGELSSAGKRVAFDLALTWASGRKASSIVSVPPPSARKVSREELEVSLLAGLAGNILELQRAGLNLRSVPLAGK